MICFCLSKQQALLHSFFQQLSVVLSAIHCEFTSPLLETSPFLSRRPGEGTQTQHLASDLIFMVFQSVTLMKRHAGAPKLFGWLITKRMNEEDGISE